MVRGPERACVMSDYSRLPAYAHITLYITYRPGRAGPGWGPIERRVRIPYVTTEAATAAFDRFAGNDDAAWVEVAHLQSGIPAGVEPDAVWVAVEPRSGVSYPWAASRDVFRTLRAFRRDVS